MQEGDKHVPASLQCGQLKDQTHHESGNRSAVGIHRGPLCSHVWERSMCSELFRF